ncbi:GtrA family protein [Nocardioides sp. GY 10127]|uniref:GtrA family protein n=1 Tax=Nocardioides sp. GY 10127 TaxID=2569762 RepID=UPI0010A8308C|nr:GtrA family protein [Nocardioides sp. GY 10127]TIC84260.1 GtrA family protein [Nocardioides sp. GY 10127]
MGNRWRRLVAEATRFLAVGGLATIVAAVLFNVLAHGVGLMDHALLEGHPIWAYVVANVVGMGISYRGTRSWAFRHRPTTHADGGRTAFVIINVLTMTLPIGCLWTTRHLLGLADPISDNVSANVVGLALGVGARFWLFRTFVFTHPDRAAGSGEPLLSEAPTGSARHVPAVAPAVGAAEG